MVYYLHWHSKVSDGDYSPEDIVAFVAERCKTMPNFKECKGFAITDHDNVEGVVRAQKKVEAINSKLVVVPGIEASFSCRIKDKLVEGEILGYGINPQYGGLKEIVESSAVERDVRNLNLIELLRKDFPEVTLTDIQEFIGRKHVNRGDIVDFMISIGIVKQTQDAFRIIKRYALKRKKTPLEKVAHLIYDSGGKMIFSHGAIFLEHNEITTKSYIKDVFPVLREFGLVGHELYPYYERGRMSAEAGKQYNSFFSELNKKNGLIDGIWGEDSHFNPLDRDDIIPGSFPTRDKVIEELLKRR